MTGHQFAEEMEATLRQLLSVRDVALMNLEEQVTRADVPTLLRGALRSELEAAEIAAAWLADTEDREVWLAFARQCGDEARHYLLISDRMRALGVPEADVAPFPGHSRLFAYLHGLRRPVEQVAAAQFTREALGHSSNALFIAFCEKAGDADTAAMYRDQIQGDEWHHHEWGRRLMARLAATEADQAAARQAIHTTLELAEEGRSLAAGHLLVEALPGC
jgi:uncharacterized ferritin-like protein (DUF455 family)